MTITTANFAMITVQQDGDDEDNEVDELDEASAHAAELPAVSG